jgi:N-acetylmuramic acid 6-phosphate (MurNAc-6-P) etherase
MLTGLTREESLVLLQSTHGEVKTAIVMQKRGINATEAKRILEKAAGNLRAALESQI